MGPGKFHHCADTSVPAFVLAADFLAIALCHLDNQAGIHRIDGLGGWKKLFGHTRFIV